MVYPLHNTTAWWRHVAANLNFATDTTVVSDLKDAELCTMPGFYQAMKDPRIAQVGVDVFGEDGCADIIARCRLLRVLDVNLAHRMIGAMWRTVDEIVDRYRPDMMLSCLVDRFALDVFERILRARGVRYIGLGISPVQDQIMFMAKGEYLPVRVPTDEEVDRAIDAMTAPGFVPSYVQSKHGWRHFARLYAHFTARWLAFEVLQRVERNPLEHRYRAPRYPACGYRVRLRDWEVMRHVDRDWRASFDVTPPHRRVFLGLQVTPEAAIDYWIKPLDLIAYERNFEDAASALTRGGYRVFVKDHPSQFGFRRIEHIRRLTAIPGVTLVPSEVPAATLIAETHATVTLTGTVGLQAVLAGRTGAVAADTYYATEGAFVLLRDAADIQTLPQRLDAVTPRPNLKEVQRLVMRRLLCASVPGALHWLKWSPQAGGLTKVAQLKESLNRYAPLFLPGGALAHQLSRQKSNTILTTAETSA
jgi:hypothetical protein